jgi:hypothetical protein
MFEGGKQRCIVHGLTCHQIQLQIQTTKAAILATVAPAHKIKTKPKDHEPVCCYRVWSHNVSCGKGWRNPSMTFSANLVATDAQLFDFFLA